MALAASRMSVLETALLSGSKCVRQAAQTYRQW
jgi:hypothetical protein